MCQHGQRAVSLALPQSPSLPPSLQPLTKADLPSLLHLQPFAPPGRGREWRGLGLPQVASVPSAGTGALQHLAPPDRVWWGQEH